jgi:hypothetical protein
LLFRCQCLPNRCRAIRIALFPKTQLCSHLCPPLSGEAFACRLMWRSDRGETSQRSVRVATDRREREKEQVGSPRRLPPQHASAPCRDRRRGRVGSAAGEEDQSRTPESASASRRVKPKSDEGCFVDGSRRAPRVAAPATGDTPG